MSIEQGSVISFDVGIPPVPNRGLRLAQGFHIPGMIAPRRPDLYVGSYGEPIDEVGVGDVEIRELNPGETLTTRGLITCTGFGMKLARIGHPNAGERTLVALAHFAFPADAAFDKLLQQLDDFGLKIIDLAVSAPGEMFTSDDRSFPRTKSALAESYNGLRRRFNPYSRLDLRFEGEIGGMIIDGNKASFTRSTNSDLRQHGFYENWRTIEWER